VPLSGCEGNTFFDDASCQKSWAVDGVELCVTHLTLYLIIISFVQAHHSSSPAILSVRAVNKYALSVYRVLAEFMFRLTRSQAVARIADRTASQHLWGSRDVIGHVIYHMLLPIWWSFRTKPLSPTVSEIFNVKCNAVVDVT